MVDGRDLVLQEPIREYWKQNHIYEDCDSQLRLILRAYCPLDKKIEYLTQIGNCENIIQFYKDSIKEINNLTDTIFYCYDISSLLDSKQMFDPFGNLFSSVYTSFDKLLENISDLYNFERNYLVECNIIKDGEIIKEYELFLINKEISSIYMYTEENNIIYSNNDEMPIHVQIYERTSLGNFINKNAQLYPFKNGTKIRFKNNVMPKEIIKYIYTDVDYMGENYIYLSDKFYNNDIPYLSNDIDISTGIFQHFYNYYDWIEEVK